jgi:hypothetical protein
MASSCDCGRIDLDTLENEEKEYARSEVLALMIQMWLDMKQLDPQGKRRRLTADLVAQAILNEYEWGDFKLIALKPDDDYPWLRQKCPSRPKNKRCEVQLAE